MRHVEPLYRLGQLLRRERSQQGHVGDQIDGIVSVRGHRFFEHRRIDRAVCDRLTGLGGCTERCPCTMARHADPRTIIPVAMFIASLIIFG